MSKYLMVSTTTDGWKSLLRYVDEECVSDEDIEQARQTVLEIEKSIKRKKKIEDGSGRTISRLLWNYSG